MSRRARAARILLAAAAVAAAGPSRAAAPRPCKGTLSGAVKGTFTCSAALRAVDDEKVVFEITPHGPIDGVPAYAPGAFELLGPVRPGTYTLDTLGMGRASVAAAGGTLYTATRTTGQRGEVTLKLERAGKGAGQAGAYEVRGTYRARLVPAGAGKQGEVVVEVEF